MGKAARTKRDRRRGRSEHQARLVRAGTLSPWRPVPPEIPRPDYAETGEPGGDRQAVVKSADQIERMRRAGRAAAEVLALLESHVEPGVTTDELDAIAHRAYIERGGYPSTLNYHGYPKAICTSVNEVICHGIPDSRPLEDGDIVNCDITIFLDGVHGDCSATYLVGDVDADSRRLVQVTKECLDLGVAAVRPGRPLSDIGLAIQRHAEAAGFGVVRAFVGHGIGEVFHMEPSVPHYYEESMSLVLEPGMTFTIEPMITMGDHRHDTWRDGWTAVTRDRQRTAQFEHTVLVTEDGVDVLTKL